MSEHYAGCAPAGTDYAPGTVVQLMPVALAKAAASRAGRPAWRPWEYAAVGMQPILEAAGYLATISEVQVSGNANGPSVRVNVFTPNEELGGAYDAYEVPKEVIFGPAYNLGDIIEVGGTDAPNDPPVRRAFIGYAFDYAFMPVVMTYDATDTLGIVERLNSAIVSLEDTTGYDYVFPEASKLKQAPKPVARTVTVFVNGDATDTWTFQANEGAVITTQVGLDS